MIIFLNPSAGGGRAQGTWRRIERRVTQALNRIEVVCSDGVRGSDSAIRQAVACGEREFIAAGGDGTVNHLLNTLLSIVPKEQWNSIRLGAIGLGSSNDFHKPCPHPDLGTAVPCKIRFAAARPRDIGALTYRARDHRAQAWFLSNASLGVTAEANFRFNHPDVWLQMLKRLSTAAAILDAAITTILRARSFAGQISIDGLVPFEAGITNLAILKNPHVSGSFCYPDVGRIDDGRFNVHLLHDMSVPKLLKVLRDLSRHQLNGMPHHRSWSTGALTVTSATPFAIEYDGEVVNSTEVHFCVEPQSIQVCP